MSELHNNTKIFVGGLSFETTDDKLKKYFEKWGEVIDAIVMTDNVTKRSRGFGFITYADSFSVDHVLLEKEHVIDGRRVEAKRAVPRSDLNPGTHGFQTNAHDNHKLKAAPLELNVGDSPRTSSDNSDSGFHDINLHTSAKIFVGGLHYETRDNIFRAYFEQFGNVLAAEVMFNRETRKSRGFGFVVFESVESANAVLQHPHHSIDGKLVEVKKAVPRVVPSSSPTYLSPEGTPFRHCSAAMQGLADSFPLIEEKFMSLGNQQLREQHLENVKRYAAVAAVAAADSYAAAVGINTPNFPGGFSNVSSSNPASAPQSFQSFNQCSSSFTPLSYLRNFSGSAGCSSPSTSEPCSLNMYDSWDSFRHINIEEKIEKSFSDIWDLNSSSDTEKEKPHIPPPITCTSILPGDFAKGPLTGSPTCEEVERAIADLSLCTSRTSSSPDAFDFSPHQMRTPWFSEVVGSNLSKSTGHLLTPTASDFDFLDKKSSPVKGNYFVHSKSLRLNDDLGSKSRVRVGKSIF